MHILKNTNFLAKNPNLKAEITVRQRLKGWLLSQSTSSQAQCLFSIGNT